MTHGSLPITGGCCCGAVRYECSVPPIGGGYCHCRTCQQVYGFHWVGRGFPRNKFKITQGVPKYFSETESVRRGFCADCGSPVVMTYAGADWIAVNAGSLDHPDDWPMSGETNDVHMYVSSKIAWEVIDDDLEKFEKGAGYREEAEEQTKE